MMRHTFLILSCAIVSIFGLHGDNYKKQIKVIYKILDQVAFEMEQKYGIQSIGTSVSIPEGEFRALGLHFVFDKEMSARELERIVEGISFSLLSNVNNHPLLRSCMSEYPFNIKNLDIGLNIKLVREPAKGSEGILGVSLQEGCYLVFGYNSNTKVVNKFLVIEKRMWAPYPTPPGVREYKGA